MAHQVQNEEVPRMLRLAVKDYGKGIPEKDLEDIFQPFHQGSTKTQTTHGGTGLGLSITRALIARLGGQISVRSKVEEFAEFVVEIPLYGIVAVDVQQSTVDALRDTTIVVLDQNEEPPKNGPFSPEAIQAFGLDVVHMNNWDSLDESLSSQENWQDKSLIIVVSVEEHQPVRFQEIQAKCKDCTLITHGRASVPHDAYIHWQSLSTTFPSVAIGQILDRKRGSTNNNVSVDGTNRHSSNCGSLDRACMYYQIPQVESTRILIAEDNAINQKVLTRILKNLGVQRIDIVDNGEKAVEACATIPYSLVFMDLQMPIMDGLQATKMIRSEETNSNTKIVFCTAHALEDFRQQVRDVGADGFISKPFNKKNISHCLQEHLT
jgi:CheY-like chemotaxis protein